MSKKPTPKWETAIKCPFCGATIVSTYDNHKNTSEEDSGDEDESIDIEVDVSTCTHVAYHGIWGCEDFSATKEWEAEIKAIRAALKDEGDDGSPDDNDLAFAATGGGYRFGNNVQELETRMRKILPSVDVACDHCTMSTGDGPQGNGVAWYFYIFMRRKKSKRSVKR